MRRDGWSMRQGLRLLAGWLLLGLLAGCAAPATAPEAPAEAGPAYIFYPPPPDEPRVQFLAKFSNALDVQAQSGGLRDFVFGGERFEAQFITKPYGAAIFEGAIYVVDTRGGGYAVFDLANRSVRMVRGSGNSAMPKPINLTIDADGTRYVTDTQRELLLVFDRNDRFVRTIGERGQFRPVDVAILGERLYVTDILHNQVVVLDKASGAELFRFGESGAGEGQLFHVTNLAVAPDETLYITDTTNFRIQHFTAEGEYLREIGAIGVGPGQFARPKGIAVDRDNRIYVVDSAFQNVQILDEDGTPLTVVSGPERGPQGLDLPTVVKIDYDNVEHFRRYAAPGFELEYLVLVANQFGPNRVVVFGFGRQTESGRGGGG